MNRDRFLELVGRLISGTRDDRAHLNELCKELNIEKPTDDEVEWVLSGRTK